MRMLWEARTVERELGACNGRQGAERRCMQAG